MRKYILMFVGVVAGGYIIKGILLWSLAAGMAGGMGGVSLGLCILSYIAGSYFVVNGGVDAVSAAANGDIRTLCKKAMWIIFWVIILFG